VLSIDPHRPIYLYSAPTDMRKGFNGLCGLVEAAAGDHAPLDVTAGGLFVFINRARDRIKVLHFDRDGLAIWYKALEQGRFELPAVSHASDRIVLDATQLRLILDGIDLSSVKRRKRYAPQPTPVTDELQPTPSRERSTARRDGDVAVAGGG